MIGRDIRMSSILTPDVEKVSLEKCRPSDDMRNHEDIKSKWSRRCQPALHTPALVLSQCAFQVSGLSSLNHKYLSDADLKVDHRKPARRIESVRKSTALSRRKFRSRSWSQGRSCAELTGKSFKDAQVLHVPWELAALARQEPFGCLQSIFEG